MMSAPAARVLGVNRADQIGLGQHQEVVVAFQVVGMRGEAATAVIRLLQPMTLDHRAHGAVENENFPFEAGFEFGGTVRLHGYPLCTVAALQNKKPVGEKLNGSWCGPRFNVKVAYANRQSRITNLPSPTVREEPGEEGRL
jgi:hypothetical protein